MQRDLTQFWEENYSITAGIDLWEAFDAYEDLAMTFDNLDAYNKIDRLDQLDA